MKDSSQNAVDGAVGVVVRDDRVLLIRRSQSVVAPGKFLLSRRRNRPGETEHDALVREFQEELGVLVAPRRRIWQSVTPWQVWLVWWTADLADDTRLIPNPQEAAGVNWRMSEEMGSLPDLPFSTVQTTVVD